MWFLSAALAVQPEPVVKPATGRNEATFTLERFGRYAITAESSQGTQVRVIDRMAGLLAERGRAGERDGRVDLFLDRGDVKVVAVSDLAGTGNVTMRVRPFKESPTKPKLPPEQTVAATLADLETRSYWLEIGTTNQAIVIEASGRYLADLSLWRDGSWLVDATPTCAPIEPVAGQPQTRCSLSMRLEPGLYLLSAYGGPGMPWAESKDTEPFELQWGWPLLPLAGRLSETMGPAGFVRYRVPAETIDAYVALPDVTPFRIAMGDASSPFVERIHAEITTESRRPVADVRNTSRAEHIITLTGPPGKPYTLTWTPQPSSQITLSKPGNYWVGTISPTDPADMHDPTAVLYRRTTEGKVIRSAVQALPVSTSTKIERRFNLADPTRLVLDVQESGPYVLWVEESHAQISVAPYLVDPKSGIVSPDPEDDELRIDLEQGLYTLSLSPKSPGIATLHIGHDSWASRAKRTLGGGPAVAAQRPAVQMPKITVEPGGALTLEVFHQNSAPYGTFVRALPIDPRDALPITLLPGENLDVPIQAQEPGVLSFVLPAGGALPVTLDGGAPSNRHQVGVGPHTVNVRNSTNATVFASLRLSPTRLAPDTPLPALDAAALAKLPKFPLLSASRALGVDLEEGEHETVELGVDRSGMWLLESTGLLATEAAVRTRTRTSLLDARSNGAGRNFEIAGYLRSGDYQLTVNAIAPSHGHSGLRLRPGVLLDGGEIRDATPARVTVPEGLAVRYAIIVQEPGTYQVIHKGQHRLFTCRLEDAAGWPVTNDPQQSCDLRLWLDKGNYVLVGMPERVETRRITTVARSDLTKPPLVGHGPFALPLGVAMTHVWVEPTANEERSPDVWTLVVPAAITATVRLSPEMAGEIFAGETSIARLVPGEAWSGSLPRGPARIDVRGARRGTGIPYTVEVETAELVAGTSLAVSAPATIAVAVDTAGVYTFDSDGTSDVRARLLDRDGVVVASNDDRPDDWNFRMSTRLQPGRYQLVIGEVAPANTTRIQPARAVPSDTGLGDEGYEDYEEVEETSDGEVSYEEPDGEPLRVTMRAPAESDGGTISAGTPKIVRPGSDAMLLTLEERSPQLIVAAATSGENVGVAIEAAEGATWRSLSHGTGRTAVAAARVKGLTVRLRIWSEDARGGPVEVSVYTINPRNVTENAISSGINLNKGYDAVEMSGGAGQYALGGDTQNLFVCPERGAGCLRAVERWVSVSKDGLVLAREGGSVTAARVQLSDGIAAVLPLSSRPRDLDISDSGMVAVEVHAAGGEPTARFGAEMGLVAPGAALALRNNDSGPVSLAIDGVNGGDAKVIAHAIRRKSKVHLTDGAQIVHIAPREAVSLDLSGSHDVVASLDGGLFLMTPDGRGQWASSGAVALHLRSLKDAALLVNPTDTALIAHIDLRPSAGGVALIYGSPHEGIHGVREIWSIPVPADEPTSVIEVSGRAEATFTRTDGVVLRGTSMPIGPGGTLSLAVSPGPVLAWVQREGEDGPQRNVAESVVLELKGGASVPVRGDGVVLELSPPGPGAISLVAPCPAVATVDLPGGWSRTTVLDTGDRLDLWIADPKKPNKIHLRSLAGTVLYGELVSSYAAALPLTEGLGPDVLLAPGGSAWFRFEVTREGPVGIGARAQAERVDAILHDETGKELARGLVILKTLTPGRYLLSLSQPVGSAPVRVRPAVVGLDAPPTTPPADIIETYRALAGETP